MGKQKGAKNPNEKLFFYHCGIEDVTEGHRPSTVGGVLVGTTLKLGIAQTSPCDTFNKRLGREIAIGRARKKPVQTETVPEGANPGKLFVEVAEKLVNSKHTKILYLPKE